MIDYAILQIAGKQYKFVPGKAVEIVWNDDKIESKTLMVAEDGKLKLGKPYVDLDLKLKVQENLKGKKIRVAKYHPKSNYRRVKGSRSKIAKVVMA